MEDETMLHYESGKVGPRTARTLAQMEAEYREKLGLTPLQRASVLTDQLRDLIIPSDAMVALRKKWAERTDR